MSYRNTSALFLGFTLFPTGMLAHTLLGLQFLLPDGSLVRPVGGLVKPEQALRGLLDERFAIG